jgi:hypothetical protein
MRSESSIAGLSAEVGVGLDVALSSLVSIGAGLDVALVKLGREATQCDPPTACEVDGFSFDRDGDGAGLQLRLGAQASLTL